MHAHTRTHTNAKFLLTQYKNLAQMFYFFKNSNHWTMPQCVQVHSVLNQQPQSVSFSIGERDDNDEKKDKKKN